MKKMKIILCLSMFFVAVMIVPAFADTATLGGSTDYTLTITVSPSVALDYNVAGSHATFAMTSYNSKGSIEYGVGSDTSLVYQKKNATAVIIGTDAVTATTAFTTGAGWLPMNSGS